MRSGVQTSEHGSTRSLNEFLQIVKGDVLVSPTGGTAVVFTGVETLSRKKVGSSKRKESGDESDERAVGPMDTKKRVSDWQLVKKFVADRMTTM